MIVVKFEKDDEKRKVSLHINGHAQSAEYGKDLICAGASVLAYTVGQNVKVALERGLIKGNPTIKLREGSTIISCRAVSDEAYDDVVRTFEVIGLGFVVLAHNYPQYVACELFEPEKA